MSNPCDLSIDVYFVYIIYIKVLLGVVVLREEMYFFVAINILAHGNIEKNTSRKAAAF